MYYTLFFPKKGLVLFSCGRRIVVMNAVAGYSQLIYPPVTGHQKLLFQFSQLIICCT